ncbi:MAG: PHB depolymerase family esterase [Lysobacter sp.]
MKPLDTFLSKLARVAPRSAAKRAGTAVSVDIAATIDQALASAGLIARPDAGSVVASMARGVSLDRHFKNAAGARAYTLYIPPGLDATVCAPLVVMLHGCTQNSADFAAGTRMNVLADKFGVRVAYPDQTSRENAGSCWNWFRSEDQRRDSGEPSILAGIVADIAANVSVDPKRVYVAGLSAGAAMAVILGRTYPDVFAGVGAHSGLPFAAATDMAGAFAAMQGRGVAAANPAATRTVAQVRGARTIPTIVFHGDADRTVNVSNGRAIVEDTVHAPGSEAALKVRSVQSEVAGRSYTRETHTDPTGTALVEFWRVHGAGHTWSGGDAAGSHVDTGGPDASAEMLRFFLEHAKA